MCLDNWSKEIDRGKYSRCHIPRLWSTKTIIVVVSSLFQRQEIYSKSINGTISNSHPVLGGVPQGPLLFNVYISDLTFGFNSIASCFVNDTNFFSNPLLNPCDNWNVGVNFDFLH